MKESVSTWLLNLPKQSNRTMNGRGIEEAPPTQRRKVRNSLVLQKVPRAPVHCQTIQKSYKNLWKIRQVSSAQWCWLSA